MSYRREPLPLIHPNALRDDEGAIFDEMIGAYLRTLTRGAIAYAAHYAHHARAGTVNAAADGEGWAIGVRTRARIRRDIDARRRAAMTDAENDAARREEDRIEDGQARWAETGSTRR